MLSCLRRWGSAHRYGLLAAAVILAACGIRLGLALAGWPGTDSDDATMGLMAKHILTRGERPIFFYGQAYMGTIEAYAGALLFAVLGVSQVALRCALILLYACFMAAMYALLAQAFDRRWAVVGLLFLAVGSDQTLYHLLEAYGGYLETLIFGVLTTALAIWLARGYGDPAGTQRRRWAYLAWGLAAGLGLWSDPLVAPFVALSALLIFVTCWREVRSRLAVLAVIGLLAGLSPWIVYAVSARSPDAAKSFLQHTPPPHMAVTAAAPGLGEMALDRALGTVLISVPNTTGATAFCSLTPTEAWPPSQWKTQPIRACMAVRAAWGSGFLLLLGAALALELKALWGLLRLGTGAWTTAERHEAARMGSRLVALGGSAVTILLFAFSSAAAAAPWEDTRYLVGVLIALPVMVATLWERAARADVKLPRWGGGRIITAGMAGLLLVTLALSTVGAYRSIGATRVQNQQQADLVLRLIQRGDTRIYSEFWTCLRTVFQSDERVVCTVVTGQLDAAQSRYPAYDALVQAAPHPAYVFPLRSTPARIFPQWAAARGWRIETETVDGQWVIYRVVGGGG